MADQTTRPQYYSSVTTTWGNKANPDQGVPSEASIDSQDEQVSLPTHDTSLDSPSTAKDANFFWLSEYSKAELVSSFLKPVSSKSSRSSFFVKEISVSAKSSKSSLRDKEEGSSPVCPPSASPSPSIMAEGMSRPPTQADSASEAKTKHQDDAISSASPSNRTSALSEPQNNPPAYPSASTLSAVDLEKQQMSEEVEVWSPGRAEWLIMITMAVSCLTVALDATILVPVLPTLALDLHGTATEAFWAGTSYLLASAVVQPFISALSDIFGRREATLVSLTLFAVGSIICGVAHNFTTLLAGRVIQGIGGGGIISQSQIVFADVVPLRQRPKYFALVLGAWAVGTMFGPLIGGAFVQSAHNWRWCFFLNLPICGVAIGMCCLFLKLTAEYRTFSQKLRMVDWAGGFLFIASMTSFLMAISWGGISFAWSSWRTLVPLIVGAAGVCATILYEARVAKNPFLNRTLFHNFSSILTYILALFQGLTLFMALYYIAFYFSSAKLKNPVEDGISLFPATFLLLPGSIVCSQIITRTGIYRPFIWLGWALSAIGSGLMIRWDVYTSTAYWVCTMCILGLGLGMCLSCINFAVQASTEPANAGNAAAMYAFMRSLGMSLGVAIGGTIFQNLMTHSLENARLDPNIAKIAEAWLDTVLRKLEPNGYTRIHGQQAYVDGLKGVWITMTAICGFAFLLGFLLKQYSLDMMLDSKFAVKKEKSEMDTEKDAERDAEAGRVVNSA